MRFYLVCVRFGCAFNSITCVNLKFKMCIELPYVHTIFAHTRRQNLQILWECKVWSNCAVWMFFTTIQKARNAYTKIKSAEKNSNISDKRPPDECLWLRAFLSTLSYKICSICVFQHMRLFIHFNIWVLNAWTGILLSNWIPPASPTPHGPATALSSDLP